jgi:TDG/mug DNA glycosylase family protein
VPTRGELEAAYGLTIPDVVPPVGGVLFCGINPSLWSAAVGHHFARPGNRFWPALHASGFTDRLLSPDEDTRLPAYGLGVTNVVARATARADELAPAEYVAGAAALARRVTSWRPAWVAIAGVTAYRAAFGEPRASVGPQERLLASARIWVVPNPSGLNAHWSATALAAAYAELRAVARPA